MSKIEATRRTMRNSATAALPAEALERVEAPDRLQLGLRFKAADVTRWAGTVRAERKAASRRRRARAR